MYFIILLESVLIMFWIDIKYDTSETQNTTMIINSQSYATSKYNALDVVGNDILIFDKISDEDKLAIWLNSPLNKEMLSYSPNMQIMEDFFNDRVEDNGKFKNSFINKLYERSSR